MFSSPFGVIHFLTGHVLILSLVESRVLVPFRGNTFLNLNEMMEWGASTMFSSPFGVIHFLTNTHHTQGGIKMISRPLSG